MAEPSIPQKAPYPVDLEEGKNYAWCACGESSIQPFCDGSHKGTGLMPRVFTAEESKKAYLCGCKHTGNGPFCDGSHSDLG